MKFKKTVSAVAALAMSVSMLASMTITASADTTDNLTLSQSASYDKLNGVSLYNASGSVQEGEGSIFNKDKSSTYHGVSILEFELPAAAANSLKEATLTYTVRNTSTRKGDRTHDVYPADVTLDSATVESTLTSFVCGTSMYTTAGVAASSTKDYTIPSDSIKDYVAGKLKENSTSKVQFALSNAAQLLVVNFATAKLNLTFFDEGVRTYGTTIKTTPYSKVTVITTEPDKAAGEAVVYYSNSIGEAELPDAVEGTKYDYTIEKGGYTTVTDTATVGTDALVIEKSLTAEHLYYEDFNTTGTVAEDLSGESTAANVFGITTKYGTIKLNLNNAVLSAYNGGSGPRNISMPIGTKIAKNYEINMRATLPKTDSYILFRNAKNEVVAGVVGNADGKLSLTATGTNYNTHNALYTGTAVEIGTIEAGSTFDINIIFDTDKDTVTAKVGNNTATVAYTAEPGAISSMFMGSNRYFTTTIDSLSIDEYEAPVVPTLPEVKVDLFGTYTEDKASKPAKAFIGTYVPNNYEAKTVTWKVGEVSQKLALPASFSGETTVVLGLVVTAPADKLETVTAETVTAVLDAAE